MPLKAFVALLGLFLAHNVAWLVKNQLDRSCQQKVCRSPRDLEQVAARSPHAQIASTNTLLYFLGQRVPEGTPIVLPPWMESYQIAFVQVARMAPRIADRAATVSGARAEALRGRATAVRAWQRRGGTRPIVQPVYLVIDAQAREYVVAELEGHAYGPLFVVPREALEAVQ